MSPPLLLDVPLDVPPVALPSVSASPVISIIIPCRNEVRHIETCLRNVLAFEEPAGGFEIIVADGMSDDGTRGIIARIAATDERVRMVDNPRRTTPCGLNAAIAAARGAMIVRIDAHTQYAPDYLCQCLAVMQETGADNVGSPWVAKGTTYLQRAIAAVFASPFAAGGARCHRADYEGPVDTVYLGCWPRQVFERIGLFDEELVRNQDDELNFRLIKAGGKIWQSPRIRSWYTPRSSLYSLFRQYFQYGYWKVRVIQKHGAPASLRHVVPGTFVATLIVLMTAAPFSGLAQRCLAALGGAYLLAAILASVATAASAGWFLVPILPAVTACYHVGYGLGFLAGVLDFVLCGRTEGRFVALTRQRQDA